MIADVDPRRPARLRAFRRETQMMAPALDLTTPSWGRGAAVEQTLGPFDSLDGRQFWFDFYPLVRLIPVYLAGDPQPALLFYLRELPLKIGDQLPIVDILRLLHSGRYRLRRSSFWIRADLLANGAPAGGYVGLRIDGGELVFTPPPVDVSEKLTIPSGGHCAVDLDLLPPDVPAAGQHQAGIDAAAATIKLPDKFSFVLQAGHAPITQLAAAAWKLYGQHIDFTWDKTVAPQARIETE